ncbi:MAG: Sir2 family NAD-dependent protein deacetylase, partial [Trueperaceae bacterium]
MRPRASGEVASGSAASAAELAEFLRDRRTLALTGAGVSTDSGIPDYRGPHARPRSPMRYQTFMRDASARQRYWARSAMGWPRTREARPNPVHGALARLERCGRLSAVLTQNVDGLHQRGGSGRVLELHGSLATVLCLDCGRRSARAELQRRIADANPAFAPPSGRLAPADRI